MITLDLAKIGGISFVIFSALRIILYFLLPAMLDNTGEYALYYIVKISPFLIFVYYGWYISLIMFIIGLFHYYLTKD